MKILNKIQKELVAPKGQYNKFGKYRYRSCEDILEAVKPLLGEAVLTITDEIVQIGDRYYVKATVRLGCNEKGCSASAYAREPLSRKGMDESQITGAASSYARKYALNGLFCIDDTKDADSNDKPNGNKTSRDLPAKPNKQEQKVLGKICELLAAKTNKLILADKVTAIFYAEFKKYPSKLDRVKEAVEWLFGQNRADEWTELGNMTDVMKKIDQAFFDFETQHQDYLADSDGKVQFEKDAFVKAITKAFGGLPINQTVEQIVSAVKPEDVAVIVEE